MPLLRKMFSVLRKAGSTDEALHLAVIGPYEDAERFAGKTSLPSAGL